MNGAKGNKVGKFDIEAEHCWHEDQRPITVEKCCYCNAVLGDPYELPMRGHGDYAPSLAGSIAQRDDTCKSRSRYLSIKAIADDAERIANEAEAAWRKS
jgi:hypothetical protein